MSVERAVAHDEVDRLLFGDGGDDFLVYVVVKAGDQEAVGDVEHLFAGYFGFLDFAGQEHAQIKHDLKE